MWLLYLQSKDLRIAPSEMIGLVSGSYEAVCFDQATWYLGTSITQDLNKVGHKKAKGEAVFDKGEVTLTGREKVILDRGTTVKRGTTFKIQIKK